MEACHCAYRAFFCIFNLGWTTFGQTTGTFGQQQPQQQPAANSMFCGFGTNPNTTRTTGYRQNHPAQKRPSNLRLVVVLVLSGPLALPPEQGFGHSASNNSSIPMAFLDRLLPVGILPLVDSGWIPNGFYCFYWTLQTIPSALSSSLMPSSTPSLSQGTFWTRHLPASILLQ